MTMSSADEVTPFAGLTRHNRVEITDRAANVAGLDEDELPETSLASAIRGLETAQAGGLGWKVPEEIADSATPASLQAALPDACTVHLTQHGSMFVETDRFQSVISPEKLRDAVRSDSSGDPLWHVPTNTYSVVNPLTAYEPLEEAIRDEEYGDEVFGEIRKYRGGGEVHMDILFDGFQIDYSNDDAGSDPIVLGIRSGYDYFGSTALYFEGFAQDTRCDNSIRSITDKKVIRHVGDVDLEEEVQDVLEEMELMTNRLAELIELAEEVELDLLEMDFSEGFDHDDALRGVYENLGFPSYISREAASHARTRADNIFTPDMTDVWDGATYALTHHFNGGENTSTAQQYVSTANDFVMNPTHVLGRVQQRHEERLSEQHADAGDTGWRESSSIAEIETFTQSVQEKADEFESRNEQLRNTLLEEAEE